MQGVRTFGTVLTWVGYVLGVVGFLMFGSMFVDRDPAYAFAGFAVAGVGMLAVTGGMHLENFGKSAKELKRERKAQKVGCYSCGAKRRLEQPCPKCGAPPSSSV